MTCSRMCLAVAVAGLALPFAANAQVMFDTTRVTCADYLAMSSTDARLFSAFISGWFNQKTGHVTVDLNEYERNVANVRSWCATNPRETVFAGLQRATGTSGK
jgi:HdeA/HdeB family